MDAKYLSAELGGSNPIDKRMGTFVKILNKEEISIHKNRDIKKREFTHGIFIFDSLSPN